MVIVSSDESALRPESGLHRVRSSIDSNEAMSDDWYVRKGEKALGPFSEQQLRKALAAGRIGDKTAVRKDLDGRWAAAAQVLGKPVGRESPSPPRRRSRRPIALAAAGGFALLLIGLAAREIHAPRAPLAGGHQAQPSEASAAAAPPPAPAHKPPIAESATAEVATPDVASPALEPIRYRVRFPAPDKHLAEVEASYPTEGQASIDLMMPKWSPGYYHVENYAGQVQHVSAHTPDRRTLAAHQSRPNRWSVKTRGAETVVVSYTLKCDSPSVVGSWVGDDMAILNGAATFLTLAETAKRPHEIQLELAPSWKQSITALDRAADGRANHYRAADFDTLVDSPIVAGKLDLHDFEVDGSKHVVAGAGDLKGWDGKRAAGDLQKLVRENRRMWGFLPFRRYVFLCVFRNGGGGLEHRNSTLLNSGPAPMRTPASYVLWLTFVSHEYFHAFNVKRLRPVELGPFDYEQEPHTSGLWVAEGVTSYYDGLVTARSGLGAPTDFLTRLSRNIERVQKRPGRLHQTLEQSSLDVWTGSFSGYGGDNNKTVSYYDKGCVVAFLLDAKIRRETRGAKTLDDMMKLAYERYSGDTGFTAEQFRKTAAEVAGIDLQPWFKRAVASTEELDYAEALDWFGLRFAPGDGKGPTWRLEALPNATAAQRDHFSTWLEPAAK